MVVRSVTTDQTISAAEKPLSEVVREAYLTGETDGIIALSRKIAMDDVSSSELVAASVEAGSPDKRRIASILNSWIGSCCTLDNEVTGAKLAWALLVAFDDLSESMDVNPDVVTFCLVYTAMSRSGNQRYVELAESVLERAAKLSKKAGGSKRRRSLAASRRQGSGVYATDMEGDIRQLCGDDFHVLYETDGLVVVSKPNGMVCFHKRKTTAGKITQSRRKRKKGQEDVNNVDISLEDALLHFKVPLSTLNHEGRGIVHRIDRGTSGCIVLAKTDVMHAKLLSEFFLRNVRKSYSAIVPVGDDSLPRDGTIDMPVHNRPAQSTFKVVEQYGDNALSLRISTSTGRKHQVRVHCSEGLGRPILMDPLYSDQDHEQFDTSSINHPKDAFFLHAQTLQIPSYCVDVEAPFPAWWKDAVLDMTKSTRNTNQ